MENETLVTSPSTELEILISQWIADGITQVQIHDMVLSWNDKNEAVFLASELMEIAEKAWDKAQEIEGREKWNH